MLIKSNSDNDARASLTPSVNGVIHFPTSLNTAKKFTLCLLHSFSRVWQTSLSCFLLYFSWGLPYVCNSVSALMGLNIRLQTEPHPALAMEIRSMGKMGARRWAKHSRGPMTQAPWLHCGSIQTPPLKTPIPHPLARFLNTSEWKLFKV